MRTDAGYTIRCGQCPRTWRSLVQAHCQLCHRQFSKPAVADAHTDYPTGVCSDPATVTWPDGTPRYKRTEDIYGEVWRRHTERAYPTED